MSRASAAQWRRIDCAAGAEARCGKAGRVRRWIQLFIRRASRGPEVARGVCAGPASPRLGVVIEPTVGVISDYYERQGQVVALPYGHPAEDVHRPPRRRLPPHKRKRWVVSACPACFGAERASRAHGALGHCTRSRFPLTIEPHFNFAQTFRFAALYASRVRSTRWARTRS